MSARTWLLLTAVAIAGTIIGLLELAHQLVCDSGHLDRYPKALRTAKP